MTDLSSNSHRYALAALREKRSLLAGEAAKIENQLRIRQEALAHLDAVLRMFAPEIDPKAFVTRRTRRQPTHPVKGMSRRVMSALRRSGVPMSTNDVAEVVAAEHGYDADGVRAIQNRVGNALRNLSRDAESPVFKSGERDEAVWSLR